MPNIVVIAFHILSQTKPRLEETLELAYGIGGTRLWYFHNTPDEPQTAAGDVKYISMDCSVLDDEPVLDAIQRLYAEAPAELVLMDSTVFAARISAKLAHRLNMRLHTNTAYAEAADGGLILARPVYARNLYQVIRAPYPLVLTTARGASRQSAQMLRAHLAPADARSVTAACVTAETPDNRVTRAAMPPVIRPGRYKDLCFKETEPCGLETADRVLIVGRGMTPGLETAHALAHKLGAALGGTRPVVLAGRLEYDALVGQSGNVLKPKLAMVLGASGASAFVAGIEGADFVIAVNTDPNALIFNHADVGIVGDCAEFTSGLLETIKNKEEAKA